ncbi:hypothetical protein B0H17DRAFT_1138450 [Mycena rosella]|uniref:Uncharacterized protein n=1 Tax=Mycena rosella TaxID=1033263 RepID=A0AAD7G9M2_MYCRO|nr:hypothetical protein B0H17DRAFT_1138450 [Mycena rosella]
MVGRYLRLTALDRTGNPSNYLAVIASTNSTSEGDAVLLQILNPGDPAVPFVALYVGLPDCNTATFNLFNPAAILAPSDGFPHGALPTPSMGRAAFTGGYGNLFSHCAEPMAFLVQMAAIPDPDVYASNGNFAVEEVVRIKFLTFPAIQDPEIWAKAREYL